jgi:hypothetical protein
MFSTTVTRLREGGKQGYGWVNRKMLSCTKSKNRIRLQAAALKAANKNLHDNFDPDQTSIKNQ